jgi:hypothetical protein
MHIALFPPGAGTRAPDEEGVLGYVPRYAVPNTSSLLPTYTNAGAELLHRNFHAGNYDYIKQLPHDLRGGQVPACMACSLLRAQ